MLPTKQKLARYLIILVAILFLGSILLSQGLMGDDTRVHLLWFTLIFHKNGQIAIRLPNDQLLVCRCFEDGSAPYVTLGILVFLVAVLSWRTIAQHRKELDSRRRGFPLD